MARFATPGNWGIEWELTGDILDRIDIYDHVETVTGVDEKGREWEGSGLVSCGDLVEVDDAELIEECVARFGKGTDCKSV